MSLDDILNLLHQHHQRATYGAVAGLLGKTPRALDSEVALGAWLKEPR